MLCRLENDAEMVNKLFITEASSVTLFTCDSVKNMQRVKQDFFPSLFF